MSISATAAVGGTGLALPLNLGLPVAGHVEVAGLAESLGYDRLWTAEAGTNDAFGLLTACAAATERIGLATGIVPIQTRTPSLMAQSAATLQDASRGRFTLGVGVSSQTIVERWNGQPYDAPLPRLREYLAIVRALLAGEKVTHAGAHYSVDGYGLLMHVPQPPPPLLVGALNEQMLRTAGEIADAACLNWITADAVGDAATTVRSGGDADVAVFVRVCVTDDLDAARAWARREVMGYVIVPPYRRAFTRQGFGAECDAAMKLWNDGDRRGAAGSLPDAFIDELCIAGTAADVRARFDRFRTAVDEPVAFPFSGASTAELIQAELEATLTALSPKVGVRSSDAG